MRKLSEFSAIASISLAQVTGSCIYSIDAYLYTDGLVLVHINMNIVIRFRNPRGCAVSTNCRSSVLLLAMVTPSAL